MMQNNKTRVIIITGSIGTGKSTAVNILKQMGYQVLDSDKIVHEGYNVGEEIYNKVLNYFGYDIINSDKTINRQKLGRIVFNDEKNLKKLNEIVHASVFNKLIEGINNCIDKVIFLDIPLALEEIENINKYNLNYDEIWLVYVNSNVQKERLTKRAIIENKNPEDVLKIIDNQIAIDKKRTMADEVIINEGTVEQLKCEIEKLLIKKEIN